MKPFDQHTRSLKKVIRYILQVATLEQLDEMERLLARYMHLRRQQLSENSKKTG